MAVEYPALVIGVAAIMFFLLEFGMRIQAMTDAKDDPMNNFKLVFIMAAFLMGIPLLALLIGIADANGAGTEIVYALNGTLWGYCAVCILAVFGMLIYFIYWVPKAIKNAIYDKGGEDE